MAATVVRYEPLGGARELLTSREPDVLIVGPAGTGKTLAACWSLHLAALHYPGSRQLMARKTLEALKSGALNTFINGVQPMRFGVTTFGGNKFFPAEFRYPNGSVILVSGMDKADKILSAEFDRIYVNEATELLQNDWETLKSRLRNGVIPYQQIIGDCNPSGPRHWLNVRCNDGRTRRIVSTHRDNPAYWDRKAGTWTTLGQTYVQETLAGLTGVQRKRLFDGVWAAAEGLVYSEFSQETHVRDTSTDGWRCVIVADIGSRNPTAVYAMYIAGDERVHITDETYRRNMSSADIVDAIAQKADAHGADQIVIDPSAKGIIMDLQRAGYYVVPANNDVLYGIQRTHAAFDAGMTIDPGCTELIAELGMYAYPENAKTETDKPTKDFDHACDAIRYGLATVLEPVIDLAAFYGYEGEAA